MAPLPPWLALTPTQPSNSLWTTSILGHSSGAGWRQFAQSLGARPPNVFPLVHRSAGDCPSLALRIISRGPSSVKGTRPVATKKTSRANEKTSALGAGSLAARQITSGAIQGRVPPQGLAHLVRTLESPKSSNR